MSGFLRAQSLIMKKLNAAATATSSSSAASGPLIYNNHHEPKVRKVDDTFPILNKTSANAAAAAATTAQAPVAWFNSNGFGSIQEANQVQQQQQAPRGRQHHRSVIKPKRRTGTPQWLLNLLKVRKSFPRVAKYCAATSHGLLALASKTKTSSSSYCSTKTRVAGVKVLTGKGHKSHNNKVEPLASRVKVEFRRRERQQPEQPKESTSDEWENVSSEEEDLDPKELTGYINDIIDIMADLDSPPSTKNLAAQGVLVVFISLTTQADVINDQNIPEIRKILQAITNDHAAQWEAGVRMPIEQGSVNPNVSIESRLAKLQNENYDFDIIGKLVDVNLDEHVIIRLNDYDTDEWDMELGQDYFQGFTQNFARVCMSPIAYINTKNKKK